MPRILAWCLLVLMLVGVSCSSDTDATSVTAADATETADTADTADAAENADTTEAIETTDATESTASGAEAITEATSTETADATAQDEATSDAPVTSDADDGRNLVDILASGASHVCALDASNLPVCWGSSGSVGTPTETELASVAAGGRQSAGLTSAGALVCWGDAAGLCPDITLDSVDPGYYHICGIEPGGTLNCWETSDEVDANLLLPPAGAFAQVTSGWFHACALASDGSVSCWGDDSRDQLTPPDGVAFTQISAGRDFTCGLDTNADMRCWGNPNNNQGQTNDLAGPFVQVSAGFYHSCGLTASQQIECQGRVFTEATGPVTGPTDPTAAPVGDYVLLTEKMGYAHGCALGSDGAITCWGADYGGQVSGVPSIDMGTLATGAGVSSTTDSSTTDSSTTDSSATAAVNEGAASGLAPIAAGARHTCALTIDSTIECWGRDTMGGTYPLVSSDAYVGQTFSGVFRGTHQGYGLLPTGEILCWGEDDVDQCQDRPGPYIAVSGADRYACGILVGGALDCWGASDDLDVDAAIAGTWTQVASGYFHTCALDGAGHVSCWGCGTSDAGQCDTSSVDDQSFIELTSGREFSCGLTAEGAVYCWGQNGDGQAPALLNGPFSHISAGSWHACGVLAGDGSVECWGRNDDGQASPNPGSFAALGSGFTFTCGIQTDGTANCWGEDAEGFIDPPSGTFAIG